MNNAQRNGRRSTIYDPTGGGQFKGEWSADLPHGRGVRVQWNEGWKYDGEWKNGKRHGTGKYFEIPRSAPSNLSKETFEKLIYEGEWSDDMFDGQGCKSYADGSKYNGQWKAGKRDAQGVMTFADNSVYSGDWLNDQRSGIGSLTMSSGDVFEGEWKNDKKDGAGVYQYTSKNRKLTGEWVDDCSRCGEMTALENAPNLLPKLELLDHVSVLSRRQSEIRRAQI